jgi:exopolyphosphatase/guanosine-5'-triphosphate,3'-diphosphate pyrophosphatase
VLAAIDAGSNTLRLLVGRVADGKVLPEFYLRRITRLAGGFTQKEGLSPEARERTLFAFQEFAQTCRQAEVKQVRVIGTAAFRQAVNGKHFAREIREITQLPLEIITGRVEAECMACGVLSALDPMPPHSLIVDIGGGSTEFVLCSDQKVLWSRSLPLGVVRLTEEYTSALMCQSAIEDALAELNVELFGVCKSAGLVLEDLHLIATAGTVTTLAALDMRMTEYDWRRVNNYSLPLSRLRHWQTILTPLSLSEREELPGMEAGRGDLIIPGLEIILCQMHRMGADYLTVSDFGILEGLLLTLHNNNQ